MLLSLQQQQQQSTLTPPHSNSNNNNNSIANINIPVTSPQHPSDKSDSGYVDYMNLYIKNLDPSVSNNDLFNMFRKFGRIISARVMSNPQTGQSKGYGFVSYDKVEEATAALAEMNGKLIGAKQLIVAYHEPKKPRQEKQPGAGGNTPTLNNNNNHGNHSNNNNNHSPVSSANAMPFMNPIGTPVRSPHHNNNNNNTSDYGVSPNNNNNTSSAAAAAVAAAVSATSATTNPAAGMGTPYSSHDTRHPYDMAMPSVPINSTY